MRLRAPSCVCEDVGFDDDQIGSLQVLRLGELTLLGGSLMLSVTAHGGGRMRRIWLGMGGFVGEGAYNLGDEFCVNYTL